MRFKLNDNQLKQLAEFTANIGIVFVAVVISPLFSGTENVNIFNVLSGLGLAVVCLVTSLILLRRAKR